MQRGLKHGLIAGISGFIIEILLSAGWGAFLVTGIAAYKSSKESKDIKQGLIALTIAGLLSASPQLLKPYIAPQLARNFMVSFLVTLGIAVVGGVIGLVVYFLASRSSKS